MILQNLLVCELTFTLYLSTAIAICKTEAGRMKTDLGSVAPLLLLVAVIPAGKPIYSKQERKIIKNEKRCRNGVPKSTQTRKDKSDGNTKPCPSLHLSQKSKDVGIGLCIFTITFILPCLCTFWHTIPTFLFIFNDVLFCFCTFLVMFSIVVL